MGASVTDLVEGVRAETTDAPPPLIAPTSTRSGARTGTRTDTLAGARDSAPAVASVVTPVSALVVKPVVTPVSAPVSAPVTPAAAPSISDQIEPGILDQIHIERLMREPSLRDRAAGYAVTQQCLEIQDGREPLSRLAQIFGRDPLHPDARSWYRGALGEIEVARILSRLDHQWRVLHAVPVGSGGADIDHVVIGPAGVFTINTKNHAGKKIWAGGDGFLVNGQRLAHIRNSLFEAERASRLLTRITGFPVAVTPLIVIVNPESISCKNPNVAVLSSTELFRWLRRRPQKQTNEAVARIFAAAETRATWCTAAEDNTAPRTIVEHTDVTSHELRFARLRAEVERAQSRRRAWSLLGASAVLVATVVAVVSLTPMLPGLIAGL